MRKITPTQLRKDLYRILDEILVSGEGIEVDRVGGSVVLLPQKSEGKLSRLRRRPTVVGDSETLDEIGWEGEWQPGSI